MNLKSMSISRLTDLRHRVEAALASKVIDQRRTIESELAKLTRLQGAKTLRKNGSGFGLRGPVAPKYRNPQNPEETWAGRGKGSQSPQVRLVSWPPNGLRFREHERIAVCDPPNRSKVPERRSRNRTISSSLRGVSSLKLQPAQCGSRYSLQRVPPRNVLDDFCGVRFSIASAASRARRNTRSLAIFVRSARARCSYSGIERGPRDRGSCLKRSSASSLEVMKLSSALNCVTPRRLMWSLRGPTAR